MSDCMSIRNYCSGCKDLGEDAIAAIAKLGEENEELREQNGLLQLIREAQANMISNLFTAAPK